MRIALVASVLTCWLCAQVPSNTPAPKPVVQVQGPATPKAEPPVYDEAADATKEVAAAVAAAKADNKRVLIQWGANWCGWCKWLAGTMQKDARLREELRNDYVVVKVDLGRFDKFADLRKQLGAEIKSIPFLTILDGEGKALVHQNSEPFEAKIDGKDGHDPAKLLAFLKQHAPTPLVASEVLANGLAAAKHEGKLVFLHFGAPWCGWCGKLERWMAQPEIAALLGKDFVDLKIDNDRMTGGKDVYAAQLAATGQTESGIPWFVFLDADGKALAHSNGPKGNTGFPYQPEEIEHFGSMLDQVRKNLTAADVQTLLQSLHQNRERETKRQ